MVLHGDIMRFKDKYSRDIFYLIKYVVENDLDNFIIYVKNNGVDLYDYPLVTKECYKYYRYDFLKYLILHNGNFSELDFVQMRNLLREFKLLNFYCYTRLNKILECEKMKTYSKCSCDNRKVFKTKSKKKKVILKNESGRNSKDTKR